MIFLGPVLPVLFVAYLIFVVGFFNGIHFLGGKCHSNRVLGAAFESETVGSIFKHWAGKASIRCE